MKVLDWGLVPYKEAVARQLELVEAMASAEKKIAGEKKAAGEEKGFGAAGEKAASRESEDYLIFCSHPPVVTVGRGTQPGDVWGWNGEIVETSRGGRATYHGPNQIICYPIVNLSERRELHEYMRALEQALVETLREFGIAAEARAIKIDPSAPSLTGVWVDQKKIASIGIAVKKWIAYHGLALSVTHDPLAFAGIHPCGFKADIMTSMEEVLRACSRDSSDSLLNENGSPVSIDRDRVQKTLENFLLKFLNAN